MRNQPADRRQSENAEASPDPDVGELADSPPVEETTPPLVPTATARAEFPPAPSLLDRSFVPGGNLGWVIATAIAIVAALLFRIVQLDVYALSQREAGWAYHSLTVYLGRAMSGAPDVPTVSPLFLSLEAFSYFLFGVTDATARFMPALFGFGLVLLIFAFRPFVSRYVTVGFLLVVGLSPTLVFSSRSVSPVILIGFFSLLLFIAVLRAGLSSNEARVSTWAGMIGFAVAALIASGAEGITALIAVAVAIAVGALSEPGGDEPGAIRQGAKAIGSSPTYGMLALTALLASLIVFFTRFFSDINGINGVVTTFTNWGRLMGTQSSATPTSFFFWASLLYELLAVVFAIVAISVAGRVHPGPGWPLLPAPLVAWFVTALILCGIASGRDPDHLALVALPLALLGGLGLGYTFERIPWHRLLTTNAGLIPLAVTGIVIGFVSVFIIIARANDESGPNDSGFNVLVQVAFVLVLLIAPLIYFLSLEFVDRERSRYVGWAALLVVAVLLGFFTVRSTTMLALFRADDGIELLAPRIPTTGLKPIIEQTHRLSRDVSVNDVTSTDNTGSYGISIAIDPEARWPYAWYFRNFPNASITTPAGWNDADLVVSTTSEGMAEAGYVVQTRNSTNRVPPGYEALNAADILGTFFSVSDWYPGVRYLLFRELPEAAQPGQISFGYSYDLSNQLNPNFGPFNLTDDVGPGSGLGQLNGPTDIALSADEATIFVLDSGNLRVQRYERDGTFISVWDGTADPNAALATQFNQGPGGIFEGESGVTYVADTWNHRIVSLNENGEFAGEIGQRGVASDIANSPDPSISQGLFYGPRGVVVSNGEIFVTDTGNERVQVFATDGTFLRAFGGYGSGDGQLIEPVGIAIGPDGNVYVADSGNGRISIFTGQGEFVSNIVMPAWQNQSERMNYLAFGPDGVLYATSPSTGEVYAVGNGQVIAIAGPGTQEELERPLGIAIDANGMLLVVDSGNSRVVEFMPEVPDQLRPAGMSTPIASPEPAGPEESPPT